MAWKTDFLTWTYLDFSTLENSTVTSCLALIGNVWPLAGLGTEAGKGSDLSGELGK